MSPAKVKLHIELIRHLKGLLTAWVNWLFDEHGVKVELPRTGEDPKLRN